MTNIKKYLNLSFAFFISIILIPAYTNSASAFKETGDSLLDAELRIRDRDMDQLQTNINDRAFTIRKETQERRESFISDAALVVAILSFSVVMIAVLFKSEKSRMRKNKTTKLSNDE